MKPVDLLLTDASEVVTCDRGPKGPWRGAARSEDLGLVSDGAVAIRGGRIVAVGPTREIVTGYRARTRVSLAGRTLLPGLVDAHTHPVFARWREQEFELRCAGAHYEEILAAGGGIHASAQALAHASLQDLATSMRAHLDRMLIGGTTLAEAKSGYGLSLEGEVKSLRAMQRAARGHPVQVARTFLGAHVVPTAYRERRAAYVRLVIQEMLPRVAQGGLAEFCDVFVEKSAFTPAEARRILGAAATLGLKAKLHVDQFRDGGGAALAARLGAVSADHLDATGAAGARALARSGTIGVLLPTASVFTGLKHIARARPLLEAGVAIALASDFNPGTSPGESLLLAAALGCTLLGMTPAESILGITRNAAAALDREPQAGRIAVGRRADLVALDAPSHVFAPYRLGSTLVHSVWVRGVLVAQQGRRVQAPHTRSPHRKETKR